MNDTLIAAKYLLKVLIKENLNDRDLTMEDLVEKALELGKHVNLTREEVVNTLHMKISAMLG